MTSLIFPGKKKNQTNKQLFQMSSAAFFSGHFGGYVFVFVCCIHPGPCCSKHRQLNKLVSGQNVECCSKYNI